MAVFTEETKVSQIEILASGRIQFREDTQLYKDGVPLGNPTLHRSAVDVGYLNESDELVLYPIDYGVTKGLNTTLDLPKLLEAVRTPAVQTAWKQKLLADKADAIEKQKLQDQVNAELKKADEEKARAEAKAKAEEENRIAELVAQKMQTPG